MIGAPTRGAKAIVAALASTYLTVTGREYFRRSYFRLTMKGAFNCYRNPRLKARVRDNVAVNPWDEVKSIALT